MLPGYKPSFSSPLFPWDTPTALFPSKIELNPQSISLCSMVSRYPLFFALVLPPLMANPAQIPTSMSAQNQQNSPEYPHFALIYIDRQGNLRHESSLSVANSRETILSPLVTDEFLRAVQRSSGATPSHSQCKCHIPPLRLLKSEKREIPWIANIQTQR